MTRNNAWFERDIEEKSLQVEFQMHGVEKIIRDDGGGGMDLIDDVRSIRARSESAECSRRV